MSTAAKPDRELIFDPRFVTPYDPMYPDTDGKPMAESTWQWDWIVTIASGIKAVFREHDNVFVASDLLWYPVQGEPKTCTAPDVMIVFGRKKGHRFSYMQWWEEGIGPQVVFEVISHNNRPKEMARKLKFYERFGVEEYYRYNPNAPQYFKGHIRRDDRLEPIPGADHDWVSPRLGVRFRIRWDGHLLLWGPNGEPFKTFRELHEEVTEERALAKDLAERVQLERDRADDERQRADDERQRAERLAAQLRALGMNPEA